MTGRRVTSRRDPAARPRRAGAGGRPRIVLSTFDSTGNPFYHGGGAAVAGLLARWLSGEYDITVVTAGPRAAVARRDGVCYRYLPVTWAGPRAGQLLFHVLLPLAARRIPHDLWIENFTPPFSTSFLPLFSPARVVGLAQNLSGREMWRRYRLPFFLVECLGLRCYRDVVVISVSDAGRVRRCSPRAAVRVIPNSVDLPQLAGASLGGGEHILFLGRIQVWEKGLDLLLAAYQRSGVALPLLLAGAGTAAEERKLGHLLAAAGGGVRWLREVSGERKADLLRRSAFVVMPSRHETFGLSALEGMAYGKPVLHFDLPALRWMDGDLRVPPGDVAAFARGLAELAGDQAARRELARSAYRAAHRYRHEETAGRYRALIRELLCLASPRPPESEAA